MQLVVGSADLIRLMISSRSLFDYSKFNARLVASLNRFDSEVHHRIGEYIANISPEYRQELSSKISSMYRDVVVTSINLATVPTPMSDVIFSEMVGHFIVHNTINFDMGRETPLAYRRSDNPAHAEACRIIELMPRFSVVDCDKSHRSEYNLHFTEDSYDWLFKRGKRN